MGHGKDVLGQLFDELVAYTTSHFGTEEQYFRLYACPDAAKHLSEHRTLTDKALAMQKAFKSGEFVVTSDVSVFLKDWLQDHILGSDMAYSSFRVIPRIEGSEVDAGPGRVESARGAGALAHRLSMSAVLLLVLALLLALVLEPLALLI